LAKSTVSNLLSGRIEPSLVTVQMFLMVCNRQTAVDVVAWLAVWHRLRAGGTPVAPSATGGPPSPKHNHAGAPVPQHPDIASNNDAAASSGVVMNGDTAGRGSTLVAGARRHHAAPASFGESARWADAAESVRELARQGELAQQVAVANGYDRAQLAGGAYAIAWPLVFRSITQRVELNRGHWACATSVEGLQPDCLDRFHDDVESVIDDLLQHATVPITNLDGWIVGRLKHATVNAHRRRRGERGALQRPRLPRWLAEELDGDPWLTALAIEILVWVGVPATAGTSLWPLGAWAELRGRMAGNIHTQESTVSADVETVLAAMRRHMTWYQNFVERPLGRKQPPVPLSSRSDQVNDSDLPHLALVERHEIDDGHLAKLASAAVDAIADMLRRGEDPATVVHSVLQTVFGGGTGAEGLDRIPGTGPAEDERVVALVADPETIDRITKTVLKILNE
jgi:hypothetical protein